MKQVSATNIYSVTTRLRHSIYHQFTWHFTLLLGVLAMLFVSSCQKSHNYLKKTVPLDAEFEDTATLISPGSPGVPEQVRINGWGSGTPIGESTFEDNVQVDVSVDPEIIKGVETITTANGDKIFSTIAGYSPAPDKEGNYEVFNTNTIVGGTGKFAGATGSYTVTVKGNFSVLTESDTFKGTITY